MAVQSTITDLDLQRLPRDGHKYELVDGEVRVSPAGARHGEIIVRLTARLFGFVSDSQPRLGKILDSSTGFRLPGGNVRSPDVSFVAAGRFPEDQAPVGFAELAPDLAVEVLSPGDDQRAVMDKVGEYLAAGVRLVWVIDPEEGRAVTYRSLTRAREVGAQDSLDGEDVLPGFVCPLASLLEP